MDIKHFFYTHPVFRYETFKTFMEGQGASRDASIHQALNYYRARGKIISIRRLLYAVQSEIEQTYVDPYLVAANAVSGAVISHHTALELHNLAYTTFQELTYLSHVNSKYFAFQQQLYRPVSFPKILCEKDHALFGVESIQRNNMTIQVTSVERTLVDVLDRPDLAGGWEEVIRSLEYLINFNPQHAIDYALLLNKANTIAKLGYFFEQRPKHLAIDNKYIIQLLPHIQKQPYYLDSNQKRKGQGAYVEKWRLIVPRYITEHGWEEPHANNI